MGLADTYRGLKDKPLHFYFDGGSLHHEVHAISGVYEISAAEFRVLCDTIAKEHPHRAVTGEQVADLIEQGAGGDRWVRMSRAVARWIRSKKPLVPIDGYIG